MYMITLNLPLAAFLSSPVWLPLSNAPPLVWRHSPSHTASHLLPFVASISCASSFANKINQNDDLMLHHYLLIQLWMRCDIKVILEYIFDSFVLMCRGCIHFHLFFMNNSSAVCFWFNLIWLQWYHFDAWSVNRSFSQNLNNSISLQFSLIFIT